MNRSLEYPPFHPRPALRLLGALGGTAWTVGAVGWARQPQRTLQAWARRILGRLGVEATLASPIPGGAQLWVANHLSWLDPLVFMSLRPTRTLAKAEVAAYPLLGPGALRAGLRFVDRNDMFSRAVALRGMGKDLRAGQAFLLFPEGTTTSGTHLAPLREGGLRLAYRLGIPVLPFRIDAPDAQYPWVGDEALLPHLRGLSRARRTRVILHPGRLLDPAGCGDEAGFVASIRRHMEPQATLSEAS